MGPHARRTCLGFDLGRSPFEREHRAFDAVLIGYRGPAEEKQHRTAHLTQRVRLTDEAMLDLLLSSDPLKTVAKRHGVSIPTVSRYRRMYRKTGRVYEREIKP